MLTKKQGEIYKSFVQTIVDKDMKLLSSEQRQWGKSYILNELGLELQALGYRVFLLTEFVNHQEHFATDFIDMNSLNKFRGLDREIIVVLVDEYRYRKMAEILDFCSYHKIAVVGFIDYDG